MFVLHGVSELERLAERYRAEGLVLGLCHGCFDIVHCGHVHHLRQARSQVDRLFVSVTADEFVKKGPDRPVFADNARAEVLASIRYCDHVIVNGSATAEHIVSALRPDLFFKGADYRSSVDPRLSAEVSVVERSGGRVVLTDDTVMDSTSRIAKVILAAGAQPTRVQRASTPIA